MPSSSKIDSVAIGSDHAGFGLKKHLREYLEKQGYRVEDCGTFSEDPVDYPRIAHAVAGRVAGRRATLGIVIDGAGIGSAMAANKMPGVRAALCYDLSSARNSREHNNANVMTLGARLIGGGLAEQMVDVWLTTECTEERHLRRAAMIEDVSGAPSVSSGNPSATPTPPADAPPTGDLAGLSGEDLQRVVERIAAIISTGQVLPSGLGGSCAELLCRLARESGRTDPETVRHFIGLGADRVGHRPGDGELPRDIAEYIDHTLLRPDATREEIIKLCQEARQHSFASVCVNPTYVTLAARELKGTPVKVCTVVGFPLGTHTPEIKAMETRRAIREGAREIDMVINVGALKSGDDETVLRDIAAVTEACRDGRAICKVIIEAALLTDEEKVRACQLARRAKADYVKTSTGFGPGGATAHDVALMSRTVREAGIGVKAAGGIRSFADAQKMIEAGATRVGASAGVKIVKEAKDVTESV
ncbi:MAG: deoxyribose-phosphate aldolase [Phycisphaerales bacterium]|nr:MAG: deoxyribose-phosphate aldolase [Phycisphaerales bacterium]